MSAIKNFFYLLLVGKNNTNIIEKSWIPFSTNQYDSDLITFPQLIFKKEPENAQLRLAFFRALFSSDIAYTDVFLLSIIRNKDIAQRTHFARCLRVTIISFIASTIISEQNSITNNSHTFYLASFKFVYKQSLFNAIQIAYQVQALLNNQEFLDRLLPKVGEQLNLEEANDSDRKSLVELLYDLGKSKLVKKDFLMWASMPIYLGWINEKDTGFNKTKYLRDLGSLFGLKISANPYSNIKDAVEKGTHHYLITDFQKLLKSYQESFDKAQEEKKRK